MSNAEKKQRNKRGTNPNSLANLKPFEKGKSGNPDGMKVGTKQRGTILTELINMQSTFRNPITKSDEKMEVEKALDLAIVGKALKGDVAAWREVKDNVYGKLTDKIEVSNAEPMTDEEFAVALLHRMIKQHGWTAVDALAGAKHQFPQVDGEILENEVKLLGDGKNV